LYRHTEVRAIGIDYLSIASLPHLVEGHVTLLGAGVVPIEGLVMPEPEPASTGGGGGGRGSSLAYTLNPKP
jgi:kynurenine formamidase